MVTDGILAAQLIPGAASRPVAGAPSAQSANRFQHAYSEAVARLQDSSAAQRPSGAEALLNPLLRLNTDSTLLASQSDQATQNGMRPSDLMMLTMRSHEFLFHCELVANVANRSSDGMQQLFRQQS
jgi:hypothetical protein